ncbi:MAG: tRNA-intron lyase [Candidatus Aenigmarchaeota archaeon]|nr:tRNA-intron lyase [Candidatus Aenigmarchaeota archaeon]
MDNSSDVMATAELLTNKLAVWDIEEQKKIFDEKFFGKYIEEEKISYLQLSLEEGMILLERDHITILDKKKKMTVKTFYSLCCKMDPEFSQKYTVYRDLRNRGFIVKSGFKFGTHFRVYNRGVNPYKSGSKELKEHTKYNVHAVPENYAHSYQEWSRYVRLSQNIRAKALLAVVDEEADVTYYVITRIRP